MMNRCFFRPIWLCALTAALSCASAQAHPHDRAPASPRRTFNFNPGWRVLVGDPAGAEAVGFDDAQWKPVTLPHGWNEDDAFRLSIEQLPTGIAWYRKRFTLPVDAAGKRVVLEFEGVRHAGDFYVNGKHVGLHENGVMAFGLDVTDALNPPGQENVVAARIDSNWGYKEKATGSGFQWSDRNFYVNYGGISKNAVLHLLPPLHQTLPLYSNLGTTGVYVYASDIDVEGRSATIHVESQVKNDADTPRTFRLRVAVADESGTIKTFEGDEQTLAPGQTTIAKVSAKADGLNFWSWGYGYLYTVDTALVVDGQVADAVSTTTGFRKTEFGKGVIKLNDRVMHVHGYAQRTTNEWPGLGINIPAWVSDFSNGLMVESNGNLVRWMHVTPSKQDVESCDRVGLLQALPAGDSEKDVDGRRWELRLALMRDAIIYNRNNPSVVMYEAGNKGVSEPHMLEMLALRDEYDPHGGRAMGSREMLGSKTAEWGGEMLYINKSATKPLWQTEYSRDEGLRKYADEFTPPYHKDGDGPPHKGEPAPTYNRNQDSHAIENVRRWYDYWSERPGTGVRVNGGGVNIVFSDTNTHHRGAENYRRSGEVDAMRLPKDGFFAHRVMWDGWSDAERPAAHIIGHWNYSSGTTKDVHVVSSAERVELQLGGEPFGGRAERSYRFLHTFNNVVWQPGTLTAVGFDAAGVEVCRAEVKTAGEPAAIRLTPRTRPGGMWADGSDLALIDVEVVDAAGQRVPTAFNPISFEVTGPGEWRGGIAQGPGNHILAKTLPVELGINRVSVRSTPQAGTIVVRATADGLQPATVELATSEVKVVGGLAELFPDHDLEGNLSRGPTPAGDGVTPTRSIVKVAQVAAAVNTGDAANSIDDNETTTWKNTGGGAASGWIRYAFDRPSLVNEVTLKLSGWRTRSYRLRIRVDDTVVYTGETPRSLGYVTLSFPPTQGRTLTIEPDVKRNDAAADGDAFGGIVEVTGEKDTAGTLGGAAGEAPADAKKKEPNPTLSIVEAEIYGPLDGEGSAGTVSAR